MKNMSLQIILLFVTFSTVYSQVYVNNQNVNEMDLQYIAIEINTWNTFQSEKNMFFLVDYGQENPFLSRKTSFLMESNKSDQRKVFNSCIEVLNWFYKKGWKVLEYTPEMSDGDFK